LTDASAAASSASHCDVAAKRTREQSKQRPVEMSALGPDLIAVKLHRVFRAA
jgi:hypothetical protein